nr:hypothetical protein [Rhodococcus zopfii]
MHLQAVLDGLQGVLCTVRLGERGGNPASGPSLARIAAAYRDVALACVDAIHIWAARLRRAW